MLHTHRHLGWPADTRLDTYKESEQRILFNSGNVAWHKLSQRMEYVTCNMFPDWHGQILREATRGVSTVFYLQHYAKYDIWEDDTRLQLDLP